MNTATITVPAHPEKQKSAGPLDYISASRLRCFAECRLKFYFRYIAKIPSVTSPALLVGTVAHAVLQSWNLKRWRGEDASVTTMQQVFEASWVDGCREEEMIWEKPEQEQKEKTKAWSILDHYFANTPIPLEEKPEAVEVIVERDLLAHGLPPLKGVIDLVREGGRIVDFKTTARTPDATLAEHQNEVQLGCYALLYREATGHPEGGLELHHLVKTKAPKLVVTNLAPMSADQIRRLVRVMESYVAGVEAEDYIPSPGLQCSYCDYLPECRAWTGGAN